MPENTPHYREDPKWQAARDRYLNAELSLDERFNARDEMLGIEHDHRERQVPTHEARAESLLATIRAGGKTSEQKAALAAEAQVHATLALAEAVNRCG